jgi:hypothetical protein
MTYGNGSGAGFDLLNIAADVDTADLIVRDPDGEPYLIDGQPFTIVMAGPSHAQSIEAQRWAQTRSYGRTRRGRSNVRDEATEFEADNVGVMARRTLGWRPDSLTIGGRPFPFSRENAETLYNDPRFFHIRQAVVEFINNEANFTRRRSKPAPGSSPTSAASTSPSGDTA